LSIFIEWMVWYAASTSSDKIQHSPTC
jgi:hypothetical protein